EEGPSRVIPFDLSGELKTPYPASSPALLANFIRIRPGEGVKTSPNATSELCHVIRGKGRSRLVGNGKELPWKKGDFFTLPSGCRAEHHADEDAAFYWVHDEPLMTYLGARAESPRFEPTLYLREQAEEELKQVAADPKAQQRSRVSVLLANTHFDQTLTV